MNRINLKDTREILINDFGQSQIDINSITQEDRDRLLIAIAIQVGVINVRCFRCPLKDSTLDEEQRAQLMFSLYNKVFDKETGEWIIK